MLTMFVLLVASLTIFALLLLVIVVVGIRQEPPTEELSEQASGFIAAFVRRLLGLHVRKAGAQRNLDQGDEKPCFARVVPPADPMQTPDSNER